VKVVIADSGFLVALGIARDPRHQAAKDFLAGHAGALLVPAPVVTESCFFLSTANKARLLDWLSSPPRQILELPAEAYPEIGAILARYASLDPDFTDAAIVWLAQQSGCRAVLTTDRRDFGEYRMKGGKRFEVVRWFE